MADDLGYGELGIYGQGLIETPNLDALAESGIKFTQHYAGSAVCVPSRYMLMTGRHPGNAYIRGNNEWVESASPFKNTYGWTKGFLHEGGIRVPMIAAWEGTIPAGSSTDHISAFWDVTPTFAEIAGTNLSETYGISFLATLKGNEQYQKNHEFLYWEFPGLGD